MDASFAPQYIFLLKSICIMSQIALHGSTFFDWKIKSRAVRKPLPSHQERCLPPRNRYAASLRPETVTILQRVHCPFAHPRAFSLYLVNVSRPLCGESTGHRWIPCTKGQQRGLWYFVWCCLNKQWNKQSICWWFQTPWCCSCDVIVMGRRLRLKPT